MISVSVLRGNLRIPANNPALQTGNHVSKCRYRRRLRPGSLQSRRQPSGSFGSGLAASIRGRMVRMRGISEDGPNADYARQGFNIFDAPTIDFVGEARGRVSAVGTRRI